MNDYQKKGIDAYVSLIGKINQSLSSRLWWATDFSSKNRFNNGLPTLIQKFISVVKSTVNADGSSPICSVPWQTVQSLNKHFKKIALPITVRLQWFVLLRDIVLEFFKRLGGGFYQFFRLTFRYFYACFLVSEKLRASFADQKPVYVIKTFVYDHSFAKDGMYKDAFFGRLTEFLEEKGERVIFFADILGDYKSCLKKIANCPNAIILPIDFFSSVSAVFNCILVSCFYRPEFKGQIEFLNYEISDLINADLASHSSRIQPYQYLHYDQTNNLLKKIRVKTFLLTYENNPWEKMCILALRERSAQTKILGYQHTVIPQASVNMFNSIDEENLIPKPDCILTVGLEPQRIIERYTQMSSLPIKPACALRYENLWQLSLLPRTKTFQILVALEGIVDVYKMVNYILQQLDGQPKFKIIIRTHPVLPLQAFAHRLVKKLADLPCVEISQGYSLIEDIKRTDLTIYWGSTVALESLWLGKPVVHFDQQTLFSYDPLFACRHLKWTVRRHQKLIEVFEEIYALSDENFLLERQKALEYLKDYFYPVNPANLAPFLS